MRNTLFYINKAHSKIKYQDVTTISDGCFRSFEEAKQKINLPFVYNRLSSIDDRVEIYVEENKYYYLFFVREDSPLFPLHTMIVTLESPYSPGNTKLKGLITPKMVNMFERYISNMFMSCLK